MPGLIGGMARTAVVAGTATAVSNRVSRRQAERWSREDQSTYVPYGYAPPPPPQYVQPPPPVQQAPPPPAAPAVDPIEQLTKLAQLRDSGVLTEAEFQAQKAKILAS
jgi:putative oligomerization/nucleic acid binding protein